MKKVVEYFIRYSITGDVLLIMIAVFGIFGLVSMRSTFFPENETKFITIETIYPGASPEEVEEGIVAKIEDNLKGVSGIERVTSVSSENSGTVSVEIKRGYNISTLLQEVKNEVDKISSFPVGMEPPIIYKREVLTIAINFAISGDTDLRTLKRFARKFENDLLAKEGISKVKLSGFPEEEIEISVREHDLRAYSLTFDDVLQAVRGSNVEITGGTIKESSEELLIRSDNKGYYARDLLDLVVATAPDGRMVRLREVAKVRDKWSENPNRVFINGNPGVRVTVSNTIDESLIQISDMVREHLEEFNEENEQITATIINDGTDVLRQRIELLTKNGLIGFFLVLLFLSMFLQIRLAFWVALAIPISFLGMFMVAPMIGISINAISLFGMILVIGILVDDGIVISENIYRHYEMGKGRFQAAAEGTMEVLPAVFSAILTTMIAFGSFLFLEGITGDFFSEMAIVIILTLGFSLVEGALILPAHVAHSKALHRPQVLDAHEAERPIAIVRFFTSIQDGLWGLMDWLKLKVYGPSLRFFIANTVLAMAIPIFFLLISFGLVGGGFVKTTFFPFVGNDFITVSIKMPAGTREHITQGWLDHIENAVWEVNEEYKAKRADGKDIIRIVNKNLGPSTYQGNLLINMLAGEERQIRSLEVNDAIRKKAGTIFGAETVTYSISSPFGKPVSVAVIGDNLDELDAAVEELIREMEEMSGLRDITSSNQKGLREVNVKLKEKAYLLGLNPQIVISQVRQGFFGGEAQRLQRGRDEVKIWVRYDQTGRSSIGKLENMRIRTAKGESFPLKEIAILKVERGIISINRIDGRREIRVQADLASEDVSATEMISTITDLLLPPILAKHKSVSYSLEGQVRENVKTQRSGKLVFPIALILMFAVIVLTFRSVGQTLAVLAVIPFGMVGVIFGHLIFDKPISILSGLGIFALIGIMVNDALVLVSAFNILIKEGKSFDEALYEAGLTRFRPIVLTSITTIAGLGPLIFEKSFQAQFLIPMAVSVAFGLAASTLIILITLPVILVIINKYKVWVVGLWEGVRPDKTSVEPAVPGRKNYFLLWTGVIIAIISLLTILASIPSFF